jgi:hypothetical protein
VSIQLQGDTSKEARRLDRPHGTKQIQKVRKVLIVARHRRSGVEESHHLQQ